MKILLTGGGTAGHVMPNLALLPALAARGHKVYYIGDKNGIEKDLAIKAGLSYYGISTGKLRRYISLKNIADAFKVIAGIAQAGRIIARLKPNVIFSKGGFVAVPVVMAGRMAGVPIIVHESDITIGLANKLCLPHATKFCCVFPETLIHVPKAKALLTGAPIRADILQGSRISGHKHCGFKKDLPTLMVMGGSLGSAIINGSLRAGLLDFLANFNIIHITGKGNFDNALNMPGYAQFEYVGDNMGDMYAAADIVLSRAGSNSLSELLALKKPHVLIPLSKKASRGDQILNAESFKKQGYSAVLDEEELNTQSLIKIINTTYKDRTKYIAAMKKAKEKGQTDSITSIINLIEDTAKKK